MSQVRISELIAPSFYDIHKYIKEKKYTHFWLPGGRGSTKSSFVGIEIPFQIMADGSKGEYTNAIVIRRYATTLSGSVVEQIKWGINALDQAHLWDIPQAKLEFTYLPTGQKIIFRGADSEEKIKSAKVSQGYFKYIWYEELTEFEGMPKIRSINQSLMRGGQDFIIFYTYNPPKRQRSWVNQEKLKTQPDKIVKHTTYLTVPAKWLGKPFITEAEQLKEDNINAYKHEYLGEVTGSGGEVFNNIVSRPITDEEIDNFKIIREGIDFGYSGDPVVYLQCSLDKKKRRLYIFHEFVGLGISNVKLSRHITEYKRSNYQTADSAESKSIGQMQELGINVTGAKKGAGSRNFGIKYLEDLTEIIIDPLRCPYTLKIFNDYELERTRSGELKNVYPDTGDDPIDAVRYAIEEDMIETSLRTMSKKALY